MKSWRLLNNGHLAGALNMAIDQALLTMHAEEKSPPTLRFYKWHPAAVSLGYFQRDPKIDRSVCRKMGIDVVQRPSGGRAVLHQGDLTYSVIAGKQDGIPEEAAAAYQLICEGLLMGFRLLGIQGELRQGKEKTIQKDICFLSGGVGDIVHDNHKFVGSAQYWHATSLLQHGSIILESQVETLVKLWGANGASPENLRVMLTSRLTSIEEILGCHLSPGEIETAIRKGMEQSLGIVFKSGELGTEEWLRASEISNQNVPQIKYRGEIFPLKFGVLRDPINS
ncbi:MAG: biotin/lipoate A/B protein ligase family protein [Thermodesulfobacteriota bacterium]|jgi:lipoate-protein ligase A|nr:MAG: biotin/lipoate A/B protein ligase family protein [Thermodesulfobacteriota bacterium]